MMQLITVSPVLFDALVVDATPNQGRCHDAHLKGESMTHNDDDGEVSQIYFIDAQGNDITLCRAEEGYCLRRAERLVRIFTASKDGE